MWKWQENKEEKLGMTYKIRFVWDSDAAVWIATSEDVSGLILESGSFDALVERVRYVVPELIELNGDKLENIRLIYITEREDQLVMYG